MAFVLSLFGKNSNWIVLKKCLRMYREMMGDHGQMPLFNPNYHEININCGSSSELATLNLRPIHWVQILDSSKFSRYYVVSYDIYLGQGLI